MRQRDESGEKVGDKEEKAVDPEVKERRRRNLTNETNAGISTETTPGTTTNTRMEY
jgi:hypothetical protein